MSKDINLHSICGERPIGTRTLGDLIADPKVHSDALKITDSSNGTVYAQRIVGGKEDCIDVNNHCEGVAIHALLLEPHGKYVATIKGGSRNITLSGTVRGHGTEVDIDIGNISDQSDNPTGHVFLHLYHESGEPITVRVINGRRPILLNSDEQSYVTIFRAPPFWGSLFAKIVHQLRKIGLA